MSSYSVIIPAFNCKKFIAKSIDSVLNQSVLPLEIIIVDDCSTDGSFEFIVAKYTAHPLVKIYKNDKNSGVSQTRNRGISLAKGTYIAFLDSDDIWLPNKMSIQLGLMEKQKADISYTAYTFIDENDRNYDYTYLVPTTLSLNILLKENCIGMSSSVIVSEIAKKHLMSKEYMHEDYVYWLFLIKEGKKAVGVNAPLMQYRIHSNNRSKNKLKAAKNRWLIYRKFLYLSFFSSVYFFVFYMVNGIFKQKKLVIRKNEKR